MKVRKSLAVIAVAAGVAVGLAGCSTAQSSSTADTKSLTLGIVDASSSPVNFLLQAHGSPVGEAVWDFWVRWKETPKGRVFIPDAAKSWSFNKAQTQLTLHVRPGVTFSDGTKLTNKIGAKELNLFITHPESFASGLPGDGAKTATAVGSDSIVITFSAPVETYWILDALYSAAPVFSPNALSDPAKMSQHPIGSGPYTLDASKSTPGSVYVLKKNPNYWNSSTYPYKSLTVKYFTTTVSALNALKSGQIDFTQVDPSAASEVKSTAGLKLLTESGSWQGLVLDRTGKAGQPALADVRVRQAISMAFDRKSIVKNLLDGYATPSNQFFTRGNPEYQPNSLDKYAYNPTEAKKLLSEAGYPNGFSMTIPVTADLESVEPVIQQSLAEIGITVKWSQSPDQGNLVGAIESGKYPAFYFPVGFQASVDFYVKPLSDGGQLNPYGANSPEVTQLVHARAFGTAAQSTAASKELGKYLLDNAWVAVWAHNDTLYAAKDGLSVQMNNISGIYPFLQGFQPSN